MTPDELAEWMHEKWREVYHKRHPNHELQPPYKALDKDHLWRLRTMAKEILKKLQPANNPARK